MFNSVFDKTRLKARIAKILADILKEKRDSNSIMFAVDIIIYLNRESSIKA